MLLIQYILNFVLVSDAFRKIRKYIIILVAHMELKLDLHLKNLKYLSHDKCWLFILTDFYQDISRKLLFLLFQGGQNLFIQYPVWILNPVWIPNWNPVWILLFKTFIILYFQPLCSLQNWNIACFSVWFYKSYHMRFGR